MRDTAGASPQRRGRLRRLLTAAGAVPAALIVYLIANQAAGLHLHSPGFGSQRPGAVNPLVVIVVSAVAGLAAWAALALLERFTGRPRRNFLILAGIAFIASLGMPLSGSGVTGTDRLSLVLMHVAVAAVLIPGMARTTLARRPSPVAAVSAQAASMISGGR